MARTNIKKSGGVGAADRRYTYCSLIKRPERQFAPEVSRERTSLIMALGQKWVNGTVLHFCFFNNEQGNAENEVVRRAFKAWKDLGIGVNFEEVNSPAEAEVRIGFIKGDGSWSYIGRDILNQGANERTLNIGWTLTTNPPDIDTAIHEIGHTLGFPHEHQNPNAGIVWDEEAVYAALAKPPNSWDREKTHYNIIRKLDPTDVRGSNWDPNSVMHYPFQPHLIKKPYKYYTDGLTPAGGISQFDTQVVREFYPALKDADYAELMPAQSIALGATGGKQRNFLIKPNATRQYTISTFGTSDSVMVLFEDVNGKLRYVAGNDDSGENRNATLQVKLFSDRKYVLRIRMYYSENPNETSVMMW